MSLKSEGIRPSKIAMRGSAGRASIGCWANSGIVISGWRHDVDQPTDAKTLICSAHRMANMHFAVALWPAVSASFPQPLRHDPHLCLDCGSSVQA